MLGKISRWLAFAGLCLNPLFAQEPPFEPPFEPSEPSYAAPNNKEWVGLLAPGAGYGAYIPQNQKRLGIFHGVNTEFTWVAAHGKGGRGPSNWRIYSRVGILKSTKDSVGGLISYLTGANFSFENRVRRKFLIPYAGFEIGGLQQKELGGGVQISPVLGVQLLSTPYALIQAQAAYTYSTKAFDQLSGISATVTANFFFWRED